MWWLIDQWLSHIGLIRNIMDETSTDLLIEQFRELNRRMKADAKALAAIHAKLHALADSDAFAEIQHKLQSLSDNEVSTVALVDCDS
jgi:hypothetical protein